jgi:hypothetical protein
MDSSYMGKEGAPTQPEGKMGCAFTSGQHQSDFKKTVVKIFFLFHLGNGMLIINVTQSTFPLIVESNACQILLCGGLIVMEILTDKKPSNTHRSGELRFYFTPAGSDVYHF